MIHQTGWFALVPVLLFPAFACADMSIGVSKNPDTKTHFVWAGADRKQNVGKTLYLVFQNGGNGYGTNVPGEIDVTFARAEVGTIKWCSYVGTDLDMKKCKPNQALKPGGVIKIN